MIQKLEFVLNRNIDSPLGENSVFYETFVVPPELKDSYPKSEKYSIVHHQAVFCKSGIEVFDKYEKDKIESDYFTIYYEETSKNTSNFFGTACRVKMGDYARQRLIKDYNSKGKTINYDGNTVDGSVSDFNGLIKLIAKDFGIDDTLLKGAIYLEILEKSKINEAFKNVSSLNNQLADWLRGGIEATEKWKFTEENYDYIKFYVEPMYNNYQNKIGVNGHPKQEVKYKPVIPVPFPCNEYKNMSDNTQNIAEAGLKKLSEFIASFDEISTAAVFNIVKTTPTITDDILFAVTFLVKNFIEDNMPDSIKNIYNKLKVLFNEVLDIVSNIGSQISEKLNQEIAKINAFLCGILNGLISLVQLIIMLLAMIVDKLPIFELEKMSALELAKHQEKLEFIEDFVDLFDKNAKEFLNGIKKLFTDDKIWKDISTFISGLAKKISNYNECFWAYFIGGVAFELILDAVIAYFTGGSSLVAEASAKISRLTAKVEQAGAKALNFGKGLGRKIANSTKDLYKWLEKEFLELLEAIKNGRLANYLKTKFNQMLGREEELFDELLDELGWEGKSASKRGRFLGREFMNNRQMKALEKYIAEVLGDVGVVMRKGEDKFLDVSGAQAGFSPTSRELFFRKKFTFYEAFHEIQHALEFKLLGKEAYLEGAAGTLVEQRIRTYKREKWVYDKIMEKKHLFNELELENAEWVLGQAIKKLEKVGIDYKKM
ncbi:zincin-like metallopeptidase toxin domain-containing protein [Chryseobacterium sp. 3008163]|uniref:zincin-like metallopeptidase toxin domain-containing protein n=1 Tax=Chryseobacterium sp. 3008163 TaxID=2478663 RepID=UPI0013EB7CD2|nr:zincin-like metallopeptidase toxin domain-containing protein [Chryseobacterium sp. 3008163]